jgi:cytochrome c-type biogenesis protein CcmI
MEWLIVLALVAIAAVLVAFPMRSRAAIAPPEDNALLADERRMLLAELRELDEDVAAGRISADDRQAGRRSLAPRLRAATEALRSRGELDVPGHDR